MRALVRRGLTVLQAKRAIEELMRTGRMFVSLPALDDSAALSQDLAATGVAAAQVDVDAQPDVRGIRERIGLTREQFALRYGLEVETIRNWESGKRDMDAAARSYLKVIANDPERVEQIFAPTPVLTG